MPGIPRVDLGEGFIRPRDLLQALRADIDAAYSALESNKESQYLRRCVVRAIFSFIEATVESIKVELRSTIRCGDYKDPLTEKESAALGSLHVIGPRNDKLLPLDQNIKTTFRLASKIWALNGFRLNTSGEDFQDFLRAKSARNRLTHPKTYYDIEVTDLDMHCHTIAGMWMQAEMNRLYEARLRALAEALSPAEREAFVQAHLSRSAEAN